MNLLELRTRLRTWLHDPDAEFYTNTELNEWCNTASFEATKDINYPWKEWTIQGAVDTVAYTLPSDFIRLHPLYNVLFYQDKVDKRDIKWLEHEYPQYQLASGVIQPDYFYHTLPTNICLYPPPAAITSGTATTGASGSTLVNSAASFVSSYVGYTIANTTDGTSGTISSVTNSTTLVSSISGWDVGDEYTITPTGTSTYVYKETTMSSDAHTTLVATNYPYLVLYRAMQNAEIKQDDDTPKHRDLQWWESKYLAEAVKARSILNRFIRGHGGRTVSPVEMD
jgi:hypothetical protein